MNPRRPLALITILAAVAPEPALACPVCPGAPDAIAVVHPRSLQVAAATRRAIEQGDLPSRDRSAADAARPRTTLTLPRALAAHFHDDALGDRPQAAVRIHLIDANSTYTAEVRAGAITLRAGAAPEAPDVTIVTTTLAAARILDQSLDAAAAQERNLLVLDRPSAAVSTVSSDR